MSLIQLEDTIGDVMAKLSAGNPGAITVIIKLFQQSEKIDPQNFTGGLGPLLQLDTCKIYGPDIWILFKDVCGERIPHTLAVLRSVQLGITPLEELKSHIFARREGLVDGHLSHPIDADVIMERVMEQLEGAMALLDLDPGNAASRMYVYYGPERTAKVEEVEL